MAVFDFSIESVHPYITLKQHKRKLQRIQDLPSESGSIHEYARTSVRSLLAIPNDRPVSFHSHLIGSGIFDASWHLPQVELDMTRHDSLFVETWRGFGVPGSLILGIGAVNPSVEEPESEKILPLIYLLGHVAADMDRRGLQRIRQETGYKRAVLVQTLTQHPLIGARFMQDERHPSVISFHCARHGLAEYLQRYDIAISQSADRVLSICNFPAHSKEQFEMLADRISQWS